MIREIIKPRYENFTIKIPREYINKEVEFIMFILDENKIIKPNKVKNKIELLGGVLNKYANLSKMKLENKAWEMHIMDKYR